MKVAFYTLGCKVNQYETNAMIDKFKKYGYEICSFDKKADIYVINTCTVTNMSDRKSRQMMQKAKKNNPNSIMVVTGCLSQIAKEKLLQIPQIDLVLGNEEKKDIIYYIEKYKENSENNIFVSDIMQYSKYRIDEINSVYEKTRADIKIQDGCNNYCSYCIIPYARGKVRSKPYENVISEIEGIVKLGYKEVVLTGINVSKYGQDLGNISLIELLEGINKIEGIKRIRLSSIDPKTISNDFLSRLTKLEKVCPHFHLSLQSCEDLVLKAMNRKYTSEDIIEIVCLLRENYENVNITCDIIVGFPGETDESFECTYSVLKKLRLNKLHVFPYSKREGTKASIMNNQVDGNIKRKRAQKLIKLSNDVEEEILKQYIGKYVEVLTEEYLDKYTKGFTINYLHAKIKGNIDVNQLVKVKVVGVIGNSLICEK